MTSTFFSESACAALTSAPANITTAEAMDSVLIFIPPTKPDLFVHVSAKLSPTVQQGKRQYAAADTASREIGSSQAMGNDRVRLGRPAVGYAGSRGKRMRGFRS